jgi:hypothetical protein
LWLIAALFASKSLDISKHGGKKKNLPQKPKKVLFFQESRLHPGFFFPAYLALLAFSLPKGKKKGKKKGKDQRRRILKKKIKNLNSLADIC